MSITLMDTCLWGFLVVLMIYVALLSPRSSLGVLVGSVPFFLAPLSRPEAMLVAPAIIVLAALRGEAGRRRLPRLVLGLTTAFLVSLAAATVFRLSYFGHPLPNTFYAKVSPSPAYNLLEGGAYLLRFAFTSGPIICAAALFLLWCAVDISCRFASYLRTRHRPIAISDWELAALASVVLLLVPVLEGGDHFRGYRFYKPVYPVMTASLVLFLLARGPAGIHRRLASFSLPKRSAVPLLFLLAGLAVWTLWSSHTPSWVSIRHGSPIRNEFRIADDGIERGRRLKNLLSGISNLPSIGVIASGGISRTYPGRIVGLLGLSNPVIAHYPGDRKGRKSHAAFEKDAFFKFIKIDILLASPPIPPNTSNWYSVILKGLMFDPRFTREWRYGVLSSPAAPNSGVEAFYSIEFLRRIEAAAPYEFREKMVWKDKWVEVADAGHRPRNAGMIGGLPDSADTVNSARTE